MATVRKSPCGKRYDPAAEIVVRHGDGRLASLANIEDLLAADGEVLLEAIMGSSPPVVTTNVDQEVAAADPTATVIESAKNA